LLHLVDPEKCIGCYMCKDICPENAVEMRGPDVYARGGIKVKPEAVENRLTLVHLK
jgi:formate hydrogenlyase subunit 6/NADH:ubiquinone oxidoreductase subunit I